MAQGSGGEGSWKGVGVDERAGREKLQVLRSIFKRGREWVGGMEKRGLLGPEEGEKGVEAR